MSSIRDLLEEEKELIEAVTKKSNLPDKYASMLALWLAIEKKRGFEGWPEDVKSNQRA